MPEGRYHRLRCRRSWSIGRWKGNCSKIRSRRRRIKTYKSVRTYICGAIAGSEKVHAERHSHTNRIVICCHAGGSGYRYIIKWHANYSCRRCAARSKCRREPWAYRRRRSNCCSCRKYRIKIDGNWLGHKTAGRRQSNGDCRRTRRNTRYYPR